MSVPPAATPPSGSDGRGGPQRIPRPASASPGEAPFWRALSAEARRLDVARIRAALADAGPPVRHPREDEPDARATAVLVPLYEHDGEVHVVLTRRAWHLRSHAGDVSFPGGAHDPEDVDLLATALREAEEEIGLDPGTVEVIGELDHMATVSSDAFIVPFVGLLLGRPTLRPHPGEVAAVLEVPLAELLMEEVFRQERWVREEEGRDMYFFDLVGDTVWGATAAMLHGFLRLVLSHDPGLSGRTGPPAPVPPRDPGAGTPPAPA